MKTENAAQVVEHDARKQNQNKIHIAEEDTLLSEMGDSGIPCWLEGLRSVGVTPGVAVLCLAQQPPPPQLKVTDDGR